MTATQTPAVSTARRDAWRVNPAGVWLVTGLELKQRVRSTKWKVSLIVVAALIAGVTFLVWAANHAFYTSEQTEGDVVFSMVVFFVLFLGLVVSPTLSATAINGDVKEGTLAPLQATALSAIDIVLGKLLAAWIASLAFLAVALPFMVFAYFDGTLPALAMVQVVVVLAVELLVVCALGLGWSALTARTPASAVLTYMTVAVLTAILPIIFGLSAAVFTETRDVTYIQREWYPADAFEPGEVPEGYSQDEWGDYYRCVEYTYEQSVPRTELTWWMLAVNPYVIVADSSPAPSELANDPYLSGNYVLGSLKQVVREARLGPATYEDYCNESMSTEEIARAQELDALPALWPWGLLVQGLLGAGAVALGVRRVAVPYATLPAGTRVA